MSLNPDGSFSGAATTAGTYTSTVVVSDSNDGSDTTTLVITVAAPAPNQAPVVNPDATTTPEDTAVT